MPAPPPAENQEKVVDYQKKSGDAPRARATTHRKAREGRRLQKEVSGCSTRRNVPATNHERVFYSRSRTEFRGRSTCQRRLRPKTTRGWSITSRIRRTLHAPAPRPAENHERLVDCEENSEDASRAEAANGQKPREGRFFRELERRSTCQRGYPPKTARGLAIRVQNSHGATTRAIRHVRNPRRVRRSN